MTAAQRDRQRHLGSTVLRNARIVDGSGTAPFDGAIRFAEGRITDVVHADSEALPADRVLDVAGAVVSPGFIDMHSHADFLIPRDDHDTLLRSFLEQGVTSVVTGNCGISPAPLRDATRERLQHFASIAIDKPLSWSWHSLDDYLTHVDETFPAVNVAQLVGHSTLRYAATDKQRGELSRTDLDRCEKLTREALDQGACGVSFGLGYDPGMYSPLDELAAFARVAADAGRAVTSHLKAYSWLSPAYPLTEWRSHNLRALREMLEVGQRSGAALQLSHFIFVGRKTWPTATEALGLVDDARASGADVMIDAFPYTCGNTTINVTLPYWFLAMGPKAFKSRVARLRCRAELELGYHLVGFSWDDFQVMEIGVDAWRDLNGMTLAEIARSWNMNPFDAMLRVAEESEGSALMLIHSYSGDRDGHGPIADVLSHEACLFETDALMRSSGWPNPASMGTFPKLLGDYVRQRKLLSLPDAIARATAKSADRFGLSDRGRLAPGMAADITVFDYDTIADSPGGAGTPAGRPKGIHHVFVNGVEAVRDGAFVEDACAGRVLRS